MKIEDNQNQLSHVFAPQQGQQESNKNQSNLIKRIEDIEKQIGKKQKEKLEGRSADVVNQADIQLKTVKNLKTSKNEEAKTLKELARIYLPSQEFIKQKFFKEFTTKNEFSDDFPYQKAVKTSQVKKSGSIQTG